MATVIAAVIGLLGSFVVAYFSYKGVKNTNNSANEKMQQESRIQQAVFNEKLESLTEEVRKHNNFAKRMPVLEEKVDQLTQRIDKIEVKLDK